MSGFGGFGGFGSNQNQQQSTGFGGGFGSGSGTTTGFGATSSSSGFGAKPAFGSSTTTGGGLFGGTTATSGTGFGGFGGAGGTTASTGFGGGTSGGGLFGQQSKPAFGSGTSGGTSGGASLFGGGGTGGNFGAGSTSTGTTAFGAPTSTAFGSTPQNNGTGNVQFSAFTEKDGQGSTATNAHYQSITFMPNYQPFSFEELRLADYAQGRKHGNANGQAGAFGTSTGFGGFGQGASTGGTGFGTSSGGGLFGGGSTGSTFGQNAGTTGAGFGQSTGGGLFGSQSKPGGMFGSTTTAGQTGGLFGTSATSGNAGFGGGTGAGFGGGTTGGLFGQTQNQSQNKSFGGFGGGTSSFGSGGTGFGQTQTSTGGGLFGGTTATASPFGGTQQQQQGQGTGGFGGFGQQNQQQPQGQTGGGLFGGGLNTSQNQQKPGGLFGGSTGTTGGGLFGQQNTNQQQSGGLFGNAGQQNQQQSGGLFGSKPAATGGGLFGGNPNTNNTGGSLFGSLNTGNQQNQGGSLFGQPAQQQQNKPSLFGSLNTGANTNTGGGLFGNLGQNNQNQPGTNSLFGNTQNQQQPALGGSLFGNSSQQQPQQQPQLTTSLFNTNPYGNDLLFAGLATPQQPLGPIATPLSSSQKARKPAILPQHKVNPQASSRLITPQRMRPGYGFTYSTYGTPGSAISNASPGFGGSVLGGGSFGRSLGKSYSTSNLRHSYSAEDSILLPGAFSGKPAISGAGSIKRLDINRKLDTRRSLFGSQAPTVEPTITSPDALRKKVSFDSGATNGTSSTQNGLDSTTGALIPTERADGASGTGATTAPAVQPPSQVGGGAKKPSSQVNGKELAVVPEDGPSADHAVQDANAKARLRQVDQTPGEYWTRPSLKELGKYSREQLSKVHDFVVGRDAAGEIHFGTVDLSKVPLDLIVDKIVDIAIRVVTVYGENSPVKKPPVGQGLNVPSTIILENSWPRARAGKVPVFEQKGIHYNKHIERLKKVADTEFVKYDPRTGRWTFKVSHYTTYGLDYEGQENNESSLLSSLGSAVPATPTPAGKTPGRRDTPSALTADASLHSPSASSPEDTFEFKKGKSSVRKQLPGGFEDEMMVEYDEEEMDDMVEKDDTQQSFLDERSVGSPANDDSELESTEGQEMAGSFPTLARDTELIAAKTDATPPQPLDGFAPKSILKAARLGTPSKTLILGDDWTEQLQRTVSPRKQDRQALRETQATALKRRSEDDKPVLKNVDNNAKPFSTSIDLMNSLFGHVPAASGKQQTAKGQKTATGKGFEWPYAKRTKTTDEKINASDKHFHASNKPAWALDGTVVYAIPGAAQRLENGLLVNIGRGLIGEHKDVRFGKLRINEDLMPPTLHEQKEATEISLDQDSVPFATTVDENFQFSQFAEVLALDTPASRYEQKIWELASILFDDISSQLPEYVPQAQYQDYESRLRKDKLSALWKSLVQRDTEKHAGSLKSCEYRALVHLSGNNVEEACAALLEGNNFRLATMIAQIGGDVVTREEVCKQLKVWREHHDWSEFEDTVRAMYELLAGNASVSDSRSGSGPENKVSALKFASHFGFDWRRAFGLRLWYGILPDQGFEEAVAMYQNDLEAGDETVAPVAWFEEQSVDTGFKRDKSSPAPEDPLWGLLKLYAYQFGDEEEPAAKPEVLLEPENITGNPLNVRLSWQLLQLLRAKGVLNDSDDLIKLSDDLTSTYALTILSNSPSADAIDSAGVPILLESTINAAFVLSHLSSSAARKSTIQDLLNFHAAVLPCADPESPLFRALTRVLNIPASWLYSAKALHARTVLSDHVQEARWLILAREYEAAHEVLTAVVGPAAVVSGDYDPLREVLGGFVDPPEQLLHNKADSRTKSKDRVKNWQNGGQVYFDFVHLVDLRRMSMGHREATEEKKKVVQRLVGALRGIAQESGEKGLEERVAMAEIGRVVAEELFREGDRERAKCLGLPLAEDERLRRSVGLSLGYYRAVMAGAR